MRHDPYQCGYCGQTYVVRVLARRLRETTRGDKPMSLLYVLLIVLVVVAIIALARRY